MSVADHRVLKSSFMTPSILTVTMKPVIHHTAEAQNAVMWKSLGKYLICKALCSETKLG
jgi:hypothetical protein